MQGISKLIGFIRDYKGLILVALEIQGIYF